MASRTPSRIVITLLALWSSLKWLGRRRAPSDPKRILIAHHLLLGDTLMLTPLLAKLRERYPGAEVVMTTPRASAVLYQGRPYGVDALAYDLRDLGSVFRLLRHRGFDLAIVPGDNRYSWLARALDARWVVAFTGDRPTYKSWPVDELIPYPDQPAAWGDMVAGLVPGPAPAPYDPARWPTPDCAAFDLPPRPYCVLHVGASTTLKLWEALKWRELAEYLENRGFVVVWSGGPGEERYIAEMDPDGLRPSYAGRLDLAQVWSLLQGAVLLVCPDTGLAHLGRIVGTPTVALFGPGSSVLTGAGRFWRASPYRAVTIENFPCRDQRLVFKRKLSWVHRCYRSSRECRNNACMQAITLNMVTSAVDELLKTHATHQPLHPY